MEMDVRWPVDHSRVPQSPIYAAPTRLNRERDDSRVHARQRS